MENLFKHIQQKVALNASLKTLLETHFQLEEVTKDQLLLREEQYCQKLYFIESGLVRTYYTTKDREVSSWFYHEGQFVTAWYSFLGQTASFETLETLEDSRLYSITYPNYLRLMEQSPVFERFGRLLAEEQLTFVDLYSKGYMFLSAKERYDLLLSYFPEVELRVKLGYIASHLGISQETLSRIRRG